MCKLDKIFKYLDDNKDKGKTQLINDIMVKFDVKKISAPSYYSKWLTKQKKEGVYKDFDVILRPLDIDISLEEEIDKCYEENEEFIAGALGGDKENTIEEFWDSVQVMINIMDMVGINIKDVYAGLNKHLDKMKSRGYTFKTDRR